MSTTPSRSNAAGRRAQLDCGRIAAAALAVIDAKGLEHLSMRSLGAALQVEAMALYYHFSNKAALLEAVRDHLLAQVACAVPPGAAPLERLRCNFAALRALGVRHPDIVPLLGGTAHPSLPVHRHRAAALADMAAAGLAPERGARYFAMLSHFTLGACLDTGDPACAANFEFGLDLILERLSSEALSS